MWTSQMALTQDAAIPVFDRDRTTNKPLWQANWQRHQRAGSAHGLCSPCKDHRTTEINANAVKTPTRGPARPCDEGGLTADAPERVGQNKEKLIHRVERRKRSCRAALATFSLAGLGWFAVDTRVIALYHGFARTGRQQHHKTQQCVSHPISPRRPRPSLASLPSSVRKCQERCFQRDCRT